MLLICTLGINVKAQTDFEDLTLATDTFWNGSDLSGGFNSGNNFFVNYYDTAYYSWAGFAYSNKTDSLTSGYGNMYSAIAGSGNNNSANYSVAYVSDFTGVTYMKMINFLTGQALGGIYVTNNAYAYYSMRDGDAFAKKFGGTTGDDPDWFKLNIIGYNNGNFIDSVEFYLADYRFSDNTQDYIIKNWTYVDLNNISNADSVVFKLSSSDVGAWGMNTPAYFCLDDISFASGIQKLSQNELSVFPNPVKNILTVEGVENTIIQITDISGKTLYNQKQNLNTNKIDVSGFKNGIYIVSVINKTGIKKYKIIKN